MTPLYVSTVITPENHRFGTFSFFTSRTSETERDCDTAFMPKESDNYVPLSEHLKSITVFDELGLPSKNESFDHRGPKF